jgi:hypothetical protein
VKGDLTGLDYYALPKNTISIYKAYKLDINYLGAPHKSNLLFYAMRKLGWAISKNKS